MARYVLLRKQSESLTAVVYQYGEHEKELYRLAIDRLSGEVTPLDGEPSCFMPAAIKVRHYWRVGHFPEKGCWAS